MDMQASTVGERVGGTGLERPSVDSRRGLWRTLVDGYAAAQIFSHRELTEGAQLDRKKRGQIGREVFSAFFSNERPPA